MIGLDYLKNIFILETYFLLSLALCLFKHEKYVCKVERKAKIRIRYNQVSYLTRNTIWESDRNKRERKTQERQISRSVLSKQVIIRLQGTDKTP